MIGSAFRKVWIPYSVYMEAFKQEEPQRAVVPVLHAVFPQSVLSCSAVIGNPQRGIQELSPNKLEAIRGAFSFYCIYCLLLSTVHLFVMLEILGNIGRAGGEEQHDTKGPNLTFIVLCYVHLFVMFEITAVEVSRQGNNGRVGTNNSMTPKTLT